VMTSDPATTSSSKIKRALAKIVCSVMWLSR
jgi:hypothetical protein